MNPKVEALEVEDEYKEITIEELVNPAVESASRISEKATEAPAWVISITGEELKERGYMELSELFSDLPAMDISRPRGATATKSYWRGRRSSFGPQFLFMIDNLEWHGHVYNMEQTEIPISNIERVEIVYGPGSLMFGSNALMGLINVITKKQTDEPGLHLSALTGLRAPESQLGTPNHFRYLADISSIYKGKEFNLNVALRYEHGFVDPSVTDNYEYLDAKYFSDEKLWTPNLLASYSNLAGAFQSPHQNLGLDIRYSTDTLELGAQYYARDRGLGTQFVGDRFQNRSIWSDKFYAAFLKYSTHYQSLRSEAMVRLLASEWPESNSLLFRTTGGPMLQFYEAENYGIEGNYQLSWFVPDHLFGNDRLILISGLRYKGQHTAKNWTKAAYTVQSDTDIPSMDFDTDVASNSTNSGQRIFQQFYALYFLTKYRFLTHHNLDLGFRLSDNRGGLNTSFRVAYVTEIAAGLTLKFMGGYAFMEPSIRESRFSGLVASDSNLTAEKATTIEFDLTYQTEIMNLHVSTYWVRDNGVINLVNNAYKNAYDQETLGIDLGWVASIPVPNFYRVKLWAYASYIPWAMKLDDDLDPRCGNLGRFDYFQQSLNGIPKLDRECWVGDIAPLKLWVGATVLPLPRLLITAYGRAVSKRVTVSSNPIWKIDPYFVLDTNVLFRDFVMPGLDISFKINNLLGTKYSHPGINEASAGQIPGYWDDENWSGSSAGNSSIHPQPGRSYQILLTTNFD
ncbi:MAG: TonB-dependent receptor plug domain-containing protein [Myxococcota bacterium]|nr:TonB-dependent receptor plug domain-containing protein [Myxococcota bacterium]